MVRAHNVRKNLSIDYFGSEFFGDELVVDAPTEILSSCACTVSPPAINVPRSGMNGSKGIDEATYDKTINPCALVGQKAGQLATCGNFRVRC